MALLASSITIASQQVTVTGTGSDLDSARQDALRQATMRSCSTAVVNDREFRNRELTRNNLTAYTGCLVRDYTIVNQQQDIDGYAVTVNATISHSDLPARILNNYPNSYFIDLVSYKDTLSQVRKRYQNGKTLIDEVFYDFPNQAFAVQQTPYKISYEGNSSYINVTYRVVWNQKYIAALEELLDLLKDKPYSIWNNNGTVLKINKGYVFNDAIFPNHIARYLAMPPVTRMRILDNAGNEYMNVCSQWRFWYNMYDTLGNNFNFIPWGKVQDSIKVEIPNDLPDNIQIKMDVVPNDYSFCHAFI